MPESESGRQEGVRRGVASSVRGEAWSVDGAAKAESEGPADGLNVEVAMRRVQGKQGWIPGSEVR